MMVMNDRYPGVEIVPPPGTVQMGQNEGEWNVKWKLVGDRYTIISVDGKELEDMQPKEEPREVPEETAEPESARDELHRLSAMADY